MRLRTFTAANVAEAMAQVRAELGDEAIIVSTRRGERGKGVQVTAAVEPRTDPVAVDDLEARLEANLKARLREPRVAPRGGGSGMDAPPPDPAAEAIRAALVAHRLPPELADSLGNAAAALEAETLELALANALDTTIGFAPLADVPHRSLLLVGPPGSGKSVVAAKLAARAALAGHPVRMVTADTLKAGAAGQMQAYAKVLGQRLTEVRNADELGELQRKAPRNAPAIIDAPGTNPFDRQELELLRGLIAVAGAEPVLVLPAGGDAVEAAEIARVFADLGARRMVATRLDASRRLGGLVAAAIAGRLALGDAGLSPYLAHGLRPLNPMSLARLILRDPGATGPLVELEQAAE
jgi:flagellar biosynthesis protein FlhF